MEGPAWVSTIVNSRFPASYAHSPSSGRTGYVFRDVQEEVDDRIAYRKRSTFASMLWVREKRAGSKLLGVRTLEGLRESKSCRENCTDQWDGDELWLGGLSPNPSHDFLTFPPTGMA